MIPKCGRRLYLDTRKICESIHGKLYAMFYQKKLAFRIFRQLLNIGNAIPYIIYNTIIRT